MNNQRSIPRTEDGADEVRNLNSTVRGEGRNLNVLRCWRVKINFLDQFWSNESQSQTGAQIYQRRYGKCTDGSVASHLVNYAVLGTSLQPPVSEQEATEAVTSSYPPRVQKLFVPSNIKTLRDALRVPNKLEASKGQHHNPQNGLIRIDHMHVAVMVEKNRGMEGRTEWDKHTSAENTDAREIVGNLNTEVTAYKRHTGGREVTEGIIPPVVIRQMRSLQIKKIHRTVRPEILRKMWRITGRETSEEQSGGPIQCSHLRDSEARHLLKLVLEWKC